MQAEISRFRCKIVQTAPKTQLISPFNQKRIKKTQRHKRNNAARRVHFHTCSPLLVHRYNSAPCAHFESRLSLTPRRPRFAEKKRSDPRTSPFSVQRLGQKPPILRCSAIYHTIKICHLEVYSDLCGSNLPKCAVAVTASLPFPSQTSR